MLARLDEIAKHVDVPLIELLATLLRSLIVAPPGYKLVAADFAAIEARVVAWLAGEQGLLDTFAAYDSGVGPNVYAAFGSRWLFNRTISKQTDADEYAISKVVVLGAGFGLGPAKFTVQCAKQGVRIPPGVTAVKAIEAWRDAHPKIAGTPSGSTFEDDETGEKRKARRGGLWKALGAGMIAAVKASPGYEEQVGRLAFERKGADVLIWLPSGRFLLYSRPRIEVVEKQFGSRKTEVEQVVIETPSGPARTYGGSLAENCLAGDSLVLAERGWVPLAHVQQSDRVWDGAEWVEHGGVARNGERETLALDGVRMTADHKVFADGWRIAAECDGVVRGEVPMPPRVEQRGRDISDLLARPPAPLNLVPLGHVEPVYDIVNCGPRSRFVVLGERGPLIVHNCTQAVAYDLMAQAAEDADAAGLPLILTVHDELLFEVPESDVQATKDWLAARMPRAPEWADGLPLGYEAKVMERYAK